MSNRLGMMKFIVRRLLLGVFTLFVVSIIIFAATQALPSDAAQSVLGRNATPDRVAALRAKLGLNRPLLNQYFHWLWGVLRGNPGRSTSNDVPILDFISPRVVSSLFLLALASAISIPLSLLVGAVQARRRDKSFDQVSSFVMLGLASVPAGTLVEDDASDARCVLIRRGRHPGLQAGLHRQPIFDTLRLTAKVKP